MRERSTTPILPEIVGQHAEEAAFLWLLRDRAVAATRYTLPEIVKLDGRLEANLDGLRVAGDAGWEIVVEQLLEHAEAGEAFVAAVLALENGSDARFGVVIDKVGDAPASARGLISACGWVSRDVATARLGELVRSSNPILRSAGIAGSVIHALDPGFALHDGITAEAPELRRRAFAAVGRLARKDLLPAVAPGLNDTDAACRFWAAWSSAVLGDARGSQVLRRMAEFEGPFRERAAAAAGRILEHKAALGWHQQLVLDPGGRRAAIVAAGAIGDPALFPWLLDQMSDPGLARLAGEALGTISGLDVERDRLEGAGPPPADDEDDPDDGLPWPNASAVARAVALRSLRPGSRHLRGAPTTPESLHRVLREGSQAQRSAAVLELLAQSHVISIDIRSPGHLQRRFLADVDGR